MGSLSRKLRKNTTGVSRDRFREIVEAHGKYVSTLPLNAAAKAKITSALAALRSDQRTAYILNLLGHEEIARRAALPHAEQMRDYGFAIRSYMSPDSYEGR